MKKSILILLSLFIISCTNNDKDDYENDQNSYENNSLNDIEIFNLARKNNIKVLDPFNFY